MALLTDPDSLNQGTEVTITPATKLIKLNRAGNLSSDGVTLKCLYSFLKEEWKSDATLIKYPFPMGPITDEQFELVSGWNFDKTGSGSDYTPSLIRTGGWAVKNAGGQTTEMWAGVVTLGTVQAGGQIYCQQAGAGAAVNFNLTGAVNQAIQIYRDDNGDGSPDFDYRGYLKLFLREQGNVYASSQLADIGVAELTYQVYRFPLSDADDLKISHSDVQIDANADETADVAPYAGMSITWHASAQQRSIGGTNRNFHVIIDGNQGTLEQIYEFVQWSLRRTAAVDIDAGAGTRVGRLTNELLRFVGDTLYCRLDATGGVYVDDILTSDSNRIVFVDDSGTERTNPYTASLTLSFGENLVSDADAVYRVFFTNDDAGANLGHDYGTANAITVKDAANADMAGAIGGLASIQRSYDYDGNVQRGAGSEGDDAPVTVVAIGLATGQFVKATGTIARSTANSVSLVAALERNYQNPA